MQMFMNITSNVKYYHEGSRRALTITANFWKYGSFGEFRPYRKKKVNVCDIKIPKVVADISRI